MSAIRVLPALVPLALAFAPLGAQQADVGATGGGAVWLFRGP